MSYRRRGSAQFQGSKKAGRLAAAEDRTVGREKRKLRQIRLLSQRLSSIYELDAYLTRVPNPEMRQSIRTLILTYRPDLRARA
jgi:hypothetical protein